MDRSTNKFTALLPCSCFLVVLDSENKLPVSLVRCVSLQFPAASPGDFSLVPGRSLYEAGRNLSSDNSPLVSCQFEERDSTLHLAAFISLSDDGVRRANDRGSSFSLLNINRIIELTCHEPAGPRQVRAQRCALLCCAAALFVQWRIYTSHCLTPLAQPPATVSTSSLITSAHICTW